jgi:hypothetical protein
MNDARILKEGSKRVFDRFASVLFAAVGMEEFDFTTGLTFCHSEPVLEMPENGVGKLVGNCINPGITGSEIQEGKNVLGIAVRSGIDGTAYIRRNTEEGNIGFVGNGDQEEGTSLLAENAEFTILGIEFHTELTKAFLGWMEETVMNDEAIGTILHQFRFAG